MSVSLDSIGVIKLKSTSGDGVLSLAGPKLASDLSMNIGGQPVDPTGISADAQLTSADSGKLFACTSAGANITVTLPAVASGLRYRFYLDATAGTNSITFSSKTATNVYGLYTSIAAAPTTPAVSAKTSLVFSKTATVGDYVEFVGAGAKWIVSAVSAVKDAITTAP